MDEAAARAVLESLVAARRMAPFGSPGRRTARVARRLRLLSASSELLVDGDSTAAVLDRIVELGSKIDDQPDDVAVTVPGGWGRLNPVVLTANLAAVDGSGNCLVRLWAAALEGLISQRSADNVLRTVEAGIPTVSRKD